MVDKDDDSGWPGVMSTVDIMEQCFEQMVADESDPSFRAMHQQTLDSFRLDMGLMQMSKEADDGELLANQLLYGSQSGGGHAGHELKRLYAQVYYLETAIKCGGIPIRNGRELTPQEIEDGTIELDGSRKKSRPLTAEEKLQGKLLVKNVWGQETLESQRSALAAAKAELETARAKDKKDKKKAKKAAKKAKKKAKKAGKKSKKCSTSGSTSSESPSDTEMSGSPLPSASVSASSKPQDVPPLTPGLEAFLRSKLPQAAAASEPKDEPVSGPTLPSVAAASRDPNDEPVSGPTLPSVAAAFSQPKDEPVSGPIPPSVAAAFSQPKDVPATDDFGASFVDNSALATVSENPMAEVMAMMDSVIAVARQEEATASAKLEALLKQKAAVFADKQAKAARVLALKASAKKIPALQPKVNEMEQAKRMADKQVMALDFAIKVAQTELKTATAKTKEYEKQHEVQQKESDRAEVELQTAAAKTKDEVQQKESDKTEVELQTTAACDALHLYDANLVAKQIFSKLCNQDRIVTRSSMIHALKIEEVATYFQLPRSLGDDDRRQFETLFQKICPEGAKTFVEHDFAVWFESQPFGHNQV